MEKRYQVFISSTYTDLKDERERVTQAIMGLNCIPAGMELFPAVDEEQFNFIKKVIDDCDYYILIIGGRYGSVSQNGLSYTEMEFDYAMEKGIKVMAFIHADPNAIPLGKSEQSEIGREKLERFKARISTNRVIKQWNDISELPGLVTSSLSQAIRSYPAVGWVRASQLPSSNLSEELAFLAKENRELKREMENFISFRTLKPNIEVYANDKKEITFTTEDKFFRTLCIPFDEESISEELLRELPPNYVKNYNHSVEKNRDLAEKYNKEYRLFNQKSVEVVFSAKNSGNVKAKMIHVDIVRPEGVSFFKDQELPKRPPKWPKEILLHPLNEAFRGSMPEVPSYIKPLESLVDPKIYDVVSLSKLVPHNNKKWQSLRDGNFSFFRQELLHTRTTHCEKILISVDSPGEYELTISVICEEFTEPILSKMKIHAANEE